MTDPYRAHAPRPVPQAKKRGWLSPTSESEEAYVLLGINRSAI